MIRTDLESSTAIERAREMKARFCVDLATFIACLTIGSTSPWRQRRSQDRGSRNPIPPAVNGQKVLLTAGESEQGGEDLNGDGDAADQVTYTLHQGELKAARAH